jgi:hypothetical protein
VPELLPLLDQLDFELRDHFDFDRPPFGPFDPFDLEPPPVDLDPLPRDHFDFDFEPPRPQRPLPFCGGGGGAPSEPGGGVDGGAAVRIASTVSAT